MQKKYLVTGVAGFIGSSIARALLAKGCDVRGVDDFSTGKRENLAGMDAMEFLHGDLTDAEVSARACAGVSCVFHEAAIPSVPRSVLDPIGCNHANVTGTLQLLNEARKAGVQRVVYAGSSSAYGNAPTLPKREDMIPRPLSPYAVSKLAGEYYMQSFAAVYGLETVVIRYFNVFGPRQDPASMYSGVLAKFSRQMLAGETPTILGDGEQSRDFTYIDNVVHGNLLASEAPAEKVSGRVFNVATGKRITLNDTVEILRELTGYQGPVEYGPERAGDVKHSLAAIGKLQAAGFTPANDFATGLQATIQFFAASKA